MKINRIIQSLLLLASVCSCSQQDIDGSMGENCQLAETYVVGNSRNEIYDVSRQEIECAVVNFITSDRYKAKAGKEISYEISEICSNGKPSLYVVNFANQNGFVILSASKAMNPILAFSDEGSFDIDSEKPEGLQSWLDNVSKITEIRNNYPADSLSVSVGRWHSLLKDIKNDDTNLTMVQDKEDIYALGKQRIKEAVDDAIDRDAIEFYYNGEPFSDNDDIWNREWDYAQDYVYIDFQEHWKDYTFVCKRDYSQYLQIDNLIPTKWGQEEGFNRFYTPSADGILPKAGCVPVAISQYLYFYKHPQSYEWNRMRLVTSDDYNAKLIYDISIVANTINGSTTYDKILTTLYKYFDFHIANYREFGATLSYEIIKNKQPVFVVGYLREPPYKGHAFLITGVRKNVEKYLYDIYYIDDPYVEASHKTIYTESISEDYSFYINWGWYGKYNGYYADATIPGVYVFDIDWIIFADSCV